jgi:outer membrane protein
MKMVRCFLKSGKTDRGVFEIASWAVAALVVGLGGCTASQQSTKLTAAPQHQEMLHAPSNAQQDSPLPSDTITLTIEKAVREALEASPELEQMRYRIQAASEQVRQAEASFYPRLVVAEDFNITNNPVFAAMNIINQRRLQPQADFNYLGDQQDFATKLQGEMVLFAGGSRWFDRRAAQSQRSAVGAELEAARNQLVSKVTEVYYQWLQAVAFIDVAERALESARVDLELGEARLKAEVVLPSEVLRLKARKAEVQGNLVTARAGARKLQAGMERLMARPLRQEEMPSLHLSLPDPELPAPSGSGDELVDKALVNRPEMKAVRSLIDAAAHRVRSARGGLLPRLGANAQYQWNTEKWQDVPNSWMLGVQATWPLFEGGVSLSKLREAEARLKETEARGKQVALDIALEVQQAALTVQEAAEKINAMAERRTWAQEALEEVRRLYDKQVVTVDALLQAEVAWNQAEVAYMASLFEGRIAQTYLRRSLGDLAEAVNG